MKVTVTSKLSVSSSSVLRGLFQSSTTAERGFESGRHVVSFRASGWLRFLPAGFLGFWLCGWAAGEVFAGGALVLGLLRVFSPGTPLPFGIQMPAEPGPAGWLVFGFLGLWLAFWTLGGFAALSALLETLFLRERLGFDGGGVRIERRTLWTQTREWSADVIEGFFLRRQGGVLEIQARGRRHRLLALGTPAERLALRDELRALFGKTPASSPAARELPKGWESWLDAEGVTVLSRSRRPRKAQLIVLLVLIAGCVTVAWLALRVNGVAALASEGFMIPVFLVMLPLTACAAWLVLGGSHFRIRPGSIEFRRWFGRKVWSETMRPTSLRLTHSVDSDHDDHWAIEVHEGPRARRVHAAMNELETVRALGAWLARETGLELMLPRGVELGD